MVLTRRTGSKATALLLSLSATAAIGCGGGGDSTTTTKPQQQPQGTTTSQQAATAPLNLNTSCPVSPASATIETSRFVPDQGSVKVMLEATNVDPKAAYQASCATAAKLVNAVLGGTESELTDFDCQVDGSQDVGERQNPDGTRNPIFPYECVYKSDQLGAIKYTFPIIGVDEGA